MKAFEHFFKVKTRKTWNQRKMWGSVEGCFVYTAPGLGEPAGETLETNDLQTFHGPLALPAGRAGISSFPPSILRTDPPGGPSTLPSSILSTAPDELPELPAHRRGIPMHDSPGVPTIHLPTPSPTSSALPTTQPTIPDEYNVNGRSLISNVEELAYTANTHRWYGDNLFSELRAPSGGFAESFEKRQNTFYL